MKVTGWIVDPENRILGATTDVGRDVMFEPEDVVHRHELKAHAQRLAARYVSQDIVLPDEFAKALAAETTAPVSNGP
jgi:hypothetical protein